MNILLELICDAELTQNGYPKPKERTSLSRFNVVGDIDVREKLHPFFLSIMNDRIIFVVSTV